MLLADPPDITLVVERFERPLVRYAMSIVGDLDTARDIVQDTFIRFVRSADQRAEYAARPAAGTDNAPPSSEGQLAAWLFTVCRNRALDYQRKNSRIVPMDLPDDRATEEPSPAATLERRDTASSLLQLIETLSPNQRDVIRLKFQSDLSYKEIADVTKLSVTNVGFLLHTGLKKLRALLEETPLDGWPGATATTASRNS